MAISDPKSKDSNITAVSSLEAPFTSDARTTLNATRLAKEKVAIRDRDIGMGGILAICGVTAFAIAAFPKGAYITAVAFACGVVLYPLVYEYKIKRQIFKYYFNKYKTEEDLELSRSR